MNNKMTAGQINALQSDMEGEARAFLDGYEYTNETFYKYFKHMMDVFEGEGGEEARSIAESLWECLSKEQQ